MQKPHIIISGQAGHGKDTVGSYLVDAHGYVRAAFGDPLKEEVFDAYVMAPQPVNWSTVNDRDIKEIPLQRLALNNCSDKNFRDLSLHNFQHEDHRLFSALSQSLEHLDVNQRRNFSFAACSASHFLSSPSFSEDERLALPRSFRRVCQLWGTEHRRSTGGNFNYWVDKIDALVDVSESPVVITDGRFINECAWASQKGIERINVVRPEWTALGDNAAIRKLVFEENLKDRIHNWMVKPNMEALSQLVHAKMAFSANEQSKHSSEIIPPVDDRTAALINDGSMAELKDKTEEALQKFTMKARSRLVI